tara:strand:- start:730 stop:1230 length:501 start_codon:yes stop_codon:yes gene_type:complete
MASQDKLDRTYMNMAVELSKLSYAKRKQVGCLIVKNTQIISEGYNGTPKGFPNDCECLDNITKPEVLHAESNAISKIARSTNSSDGSTLYVTLAPCFGCSKLVLQSGVRRVVYKDDYQDNGLALLRSGGVKVDKISYPNPKNYYPDDHEDEFGNGHYKGSYYGDPL